VSLDRHHKLTRGIHSILKVPTTVALVTLSLVLGHYTHYFTCHYVLRGGIDHQAIGVRSFIPLAQL
jgi:hypothetical protein